MRCGKPQSFSCRALVYFLKCLQAFDHHGIDSPLMLIAVLKKTSLKYSLLETELDWELEAESSSHRLWIQSLSCWCTSWPCITCGISTLVPVLLKSLSFIGNVYSIMILQMILMKSQGMAQKNRVINRKCGTLHCITTEIAIEVTAEPNQLLEQYYLKQLISLYVKKRLNLKHLSLSYLGGKEENQMQRSAGTFATCNQFLYASVIF